jgi:hypothetical protein
MRTAVRSVPARSLTVMGATEVVPNDIDVNPQADGIYVVNKTAGSLVTAGGDLRPAA